MPYYHDLVTKESWQELQRLTGLLNFTLLGGWAVYLYTQGLKSKDIDILIDYPALPILADHYQLVKNLRLHKYEAVKGHVQIDIYLPHYSQIGIPVEDLLEHTTNLQGFTTLQADWLLALKLYTLQARGRTPKGRKDFLDLISLLQTQPADTLSQTIKLLKQYQLTDSPTFFRTLIGEQTSLPELSLNTHAYAKLKKNILSQL